MAITQAQVKAADAAYANALTQWGADNMVTIRADIRRNEVREAFEATKRLRELKREMKEQGLKRTSMFNGGQSMAQMRANEECFRLETIIKKVTV